MTINFTLPRHPLYRRQPYYVQIPQRYNATIALDYIIPFRIIR